jgi:hypothetical protein
MLLGTSSTSRSLEHTRAAEQGQRVPASIGVGMAKAQVKREKAKIEEVCRHDESQTPNTTNCGIHYVAGVTPLSEIRVVRVQMRMQGLTIKKPVRGRPTLPPSLQVVVVWLVKEAMNPL